ncbi:MAG: DUF499 domain-containing protein [Chloroflexi bacterium]|nr:DUF499 domain-containing protein [Chloroflexota bacterium]OJV99124.1 MAG: AAA+ family ATPase [Chloroflexi bacterium 54-19]
MATSNHERVGRALEQLNSGLRPFFDRELRVAATQHGPKLLEMIREALPGYVQAGVSWDKINFDTQALLAVMWVNWNTIFSKTLGPAERSLVSELRDVRNRWAHQKPFTLDDTYRAFDSIQRLLTAISAPEANEIEKAKQEILRQRFEEQARRETRKAAITPIEGQPAVGLRPWREIVTPHPDVASGRYQQAEFAADLGQVHRNEGADEYRKPQPFFQRTFLTEGLKTLLSGALKRITGSGGDPVIELQTNFGGGKTHSMLALYHLFSGAAPAEMLGIETVMKEAGVEKLPNVVHRAVLVGTALSPGQPHQKEDGTVVNTMWGDLAWQLLRKPGYNLVAEADRRGVSPGSDTLRELFRQASPCLILIDEWVAYVRQLYGVHDLPAGSFDANLTFAQALTEAAKAVNGTLVVASIPASDIEIGGEAGREALTRLKNTFGRLESAWRPASAEEGFEIVRRRLFQPITDPELFPARDAVVKAFMEVYRAQPNEFPAACREADYERRLKAAFPIHPELFDRLYNDWSTLDKFQRTRGVLRLMAGVIHALWERQDRSLLIMPASVPVDDPAVQFELTRYMDDPWVPVIEKDVDGPNSLPLQLDRDNPNFGRYSACRRVTRTIYMGSAPTLHTANKGLDDRQIKLGCAQPGENISTFGDALRRLTDNATHLYLDGRRYWFSTQPSVNRLAQDRAFQQSLENVHQEILNRLKAEQNQRGDFYRVYLDPPSSDLPDEREVRLVILGPDYCHTKNLAESPAFKQAQILLDQRGNSPRRYRNTLVFLAPDTNRLKELDSAVRQFLAWDSICREKTELNLDAFQAGQANTKKTQTDDTVKQRISETFIWLLTPELPNPSSSSNELSWQEARLQGPDALAVRVSRKLRNDDLLVTNLAGTSLRLELDKIPLWRGDNVSVKQLAEDFAQYLYLPRLKDPNVLLDAISDGIRNLTWESETFAYADGFESATNRYRGLRAGEASFRPSLDNDSLLVKSSVAQNQKIEEVTGRKGKTGPLQPPGGPGQNGPDPVIGDPPPPSPPVGPKKKVYTRFHGTVTVDPTRLSRDSGQIADAVIQHLASLLNSNVRITLEIDADLPDGTPENVIRNVTENCRTLRFDQFGFEEE